MMPAAEASRRTATGRYAAKSRGGSTSPLEKHANFLLALIEVEPDLTLDRSRRSVDLHLIIMLWNGSSRHQIVASIDQWFFTAIFLFR
jgi:hypothetical protein